MKPNNRPDPKVGGYVDVRHKQGEPCKAEFTVEHFVDDWFETDFTFKIDGAVASIHSVEPEGDTLYVNQNHPARQKAYEVVSELPSVDEVERIND